MVIRGSWTPVIFLSGLFAVLALFSGVTFGSSDWRPTALLAAAAVFFALWVRSATIVVTETEIRSAGLLRRTRRILLENIAQLRLEEGIEKYSDRFKPPLRLVVIPTEGATDAGFYINVTLFRPQDLGVLLERLRALTHIATPE